MPKAIQPGHRLGIGGVSKVRLGSQFFSHEVEDPCLCAILRAASLYFLCTRLYIKIYSSSLNKGSSGSVFGHFLLSKFSKERDLITKDYASYNSQGESKTGKGRSKNRWGYRDNQKMNQET